MVPFWPPIVTLPTEPSSAEGTFSIITSPGSRSLPEDMFRLQAEIARLLSESQKLQDRGDLAEQQ